MDTDQRKQRSGGFMGQSEQKQLPFPGNPGRLSGNKCHARPRALPAGRGRSGPGRSTLPWCPVYAHDVYQRDL